MFAPPKGGKERDVPLAGQRALRLSAHLAAFPSAPVTLPLHKPGGRLVTASLVFTKEDEGAIWRGDFNRYVWHPALRAAGVTPCRKTGFRQLRHYYASTLLADGVDIRALAEYLGHSDPGFTLRIYCKSRVLHRAGEKPQVTRSRWWQNGAPRLQVAPS